MTELILKKQLDEDKLNTLLDFLKSWGVEVEVRHREDNPQSSSKEFFPFSVGLWNDYAIDDRQLRAKAWTRDV